jgi:hypothetical protein
MAVAAALALAAAPTGAQLLSGAGSLLQRIAAAPSCAQLRVVGVCACGPFVCNARVVQFVPVAFVETTRAPGDSIFGGPGLPAAAGATALGTASSSLSTTDNTAEAHVWLLPDSAVQFATCAMCRPSNASRPALPAEQPDAVCGPASQVAQAILAAPAGALADGAPALAYASEADLLNWRTGCRDVAGPSLPAAPVCAAGGALGELSSAAASLAGEQCLGGWGPLKPRQMRDVGPPPVLYSAKTAVRAMSIARSQLGTFPYPVDTQGRLQQIYPSASDCFDVGALPLPTSPASTHPVVPSPDGRYGWLYWRRTTCCAQPAGLARCATAMGK